MKPRYFLIRESHSEAEYNWCNTDNNYSIREVSDGNPPKIGETGFVTCPNMSSGQDCESCAGYRTKVEEIIEYDDKFKFLLSQALSEKINIDFNHQWRHVNLEGILGKKNIEDLKKIFKLETVKQ